MTQTRIPETVAIVGRRFGYGLAIAINLVLIWIVGNVMDWEVAAFLEAEFAELVPLIQFGMWVTVAANAVYLVDDRSTGTRVARLVVDVVNLYVTFQVFTVFPFDFSSHTFDWALVFRAVLVIALIGTAIAAITHAAQIVTGGRKRPGPATSGRWGTSH